MLVNFLYFTLKPVKINDKIPTLITLNNITLRIFFHYTVLIILPQIKKIKKKLKMKKGDNLK